MLLKARACLRKNKVFIKTKSLSIQRRDFEGGEERVLSMGGGMAGGMGGGRGIEGWECVGFVTTNKPPGRRDTMILGIFYVHL